MRDANDLALEAERSARLHGMRTAQAAEAGNAAAERVAAAGGNRRAQRRAADRARTAEQERAVRR